MRPVGTKIKILSSIIQEILIGIYIMVFCYAALSKLLDNDQFRLTLTKSPLFENWANIVSILVPGLELLVCLLLFNSRTRPIGLLAFTGLMAMFTSYLIYLTEFSRYLPCSCGGILGRLGWSEHKIFNIAIMSLGMFSYLNQKRMKEEPKILKRVGQSKF